MEATRKANVERLLFCHGPLDKRPCAIILHVYAKTHGIFCGVVLGKSMSGLIDLGWSFAGADEVMGIAKEIQAGRALGFKFSVCPLCEECSRQLLMMRSEKGRE